jgi:hypothetical protein
VKKTKVVACLSKKKMDAAILLSSDDDEAAPRMGMCAHCGMVSKPHSCPIPNSKMMRLPARKRERAPADETSASKRSKPDAAVQEDGEAGVLPAPPLHASPAVMQSAHALLATLLSEHGSLQTLANKHQVDTVHCPPRLGRRIVSGREGVVSHQAEIASLCIEQTLVSRHLADHASLWERVVHACDRLETRRVWDVVIVHGGGLSARVSNHRFAVLKPRIRVRATVVV